MTTHPVAPEPVAPDPGAPDPVAPDLLPPDLDGPAPPSIAQQLGDEIEAELSAQAADPVAQPAARPAEAGEWRGIVLVTGTDTDVGKTVVTSAIAAAAQAAGLRSR